MKMLTAAATVAAVLVSAGTAMAAPGTAVPAQHMRQYASNQSLRVASRHVERAIDNLQRDRSDYNGHKERAIDDLTTARQDLAQALIFWRSHNHLPANAPGMGEPNDFDRSGSLSQAESNENIGAVRRHIEAAIDALKGDARDYGGYKEKAIDRLQAARAQLEGAIDTRPGMGGVGQRGSDANLRLVSRHIDGAIDSLQRDRHDYGGHRVAAIGDLQQARAFISDALSFDRSREGGAAGITPATRDENEMRMPMVGQSASNESVAAARSHVERAIDALQRDKSDYGGFKEKAIDRLQAARSELLQALQFERAH